MRKLIKYGTILINSTENGVNYEIQMDKNKGTMIVNDENSFELNINTISPMSHNW